MSTAIGKESFVWHKLHSLSGIIPIGFYLLQHLTLNSFSLAGPDKYDGVSEFFYSMPPHVLWTIEIVAIYIPLLFHAGYGMFITARAESNYFSSPYKWPQNLMYSLQRYSGIFVFFFLCWHWATTTLQVKIHGADSVNYFAMHDQFAQYGYTILVLYALGVLAASYHFCFGIWNFCIRWGITIGDRAQASVQKLSLALFVLVTALGWLALAGFFIHHAEPSSISVMLSHPGQFIRAA